jgi:hypothetical protein
MLQTHFSFLPRFSYSHVLTACSFAVHEEVRCLASGVIEFSTLSLEILPLIAFR